MKRTHRRPRKKQQGSALLVSLMVMVGLSLIGLGYVAISETESAISINERNATQTREVAETGVRVMVELFQDPVWGEDTKLLPPNITQIKLDRLPDGVSIGRYKDSPKRLFDKPHKASDSDRFWGDEDHADIWINNTKLAGAAANADKAWLNDLNKTLFAGDYSAGRITEIRVYAPPFSNGVLTAGFYNKNQGVRLGLCTIAVTATKCKNDTDADPCTDASPDSRVISRRTVRAVISEWPFPGPSGPVQTNANLGTNGSVQVHWGKITATGTMTLKRPFVGLPWHDAHNRVRFEYGYFAPMAADDPFPVDTASGTYSQYPWLYAIIDKAVQDAWWEAWTRGDYTGDGAGGTFAPYAYDLPEKSFVGATAAGADVGRSVFQKQTVDQTPGIKSVLFPKFDYNFWKDVALTGDDQDNVFYLQWVAGESFKDKDGNTNDFDVWINSKATGNRTGYFFFDTGNGQNPQNGGPGTLTPDVSIKGNPFLAQGFVYSNTNQWDSAGGAKGVGGYFNAPGEPFRDIGFWQVDEGTGAYVLNAGNKQIDSSKVGNGRWDYVDVKDNDYFDVFVATRSINRPDDVPGATVGAAFNEYFPVPYTPGCDPGVDCSEPHEPYLNYVYNNTGTVGAATIAGKGSFGSEKATDVTIKWTAGAGQILSKKTSDGKSTGTPVGCGTIADAKEKQEKCTSNAYDRDGPLTDLEVALNGVLYVEGKFEQTGNLVYFGSILAQGDFGKAGTPDVWFDERLIKDEWPPREFKFPRVFISALQSD
jgi:hypothetical protein